MADLRFTDAAERAPYLKVLTQVFHCEGSIELHALWP